MLDTEESRCYWNYTQGEELLSNRFRKFLNQFAFLLASHFYLKLLCSVMEFC